MKAASKWMGALALLAAFPMAQAGGGPGAVRKQAVASMVITGEIAIDPRGQVTSHQIHQVEKVPTGVVRLLNDAVPQWRFEPVMVEGVAHPAKSKMRVRVVARTLDNGDYAISFQDADFLGDDPVPGTVASSRKMVHPRYPAGALRAGASGAVFVAVRIGTDGRVEDAVVEQVNLPFYGPDRVMESYRKVFGDAALQAAKASTFNPPTAGEHAGSWTSARIPYLFVAEGRGPKVDAPYGQWAAYVPGPYQPAPWRVGTLTGAPDLMAAGSSVQPIDGPGGLRLLTPLGEGG